MTKRLLFLIVALFATVKAIGAIPDSLMDVKGRLEVLLQDMERCERLITTPDDLEFYNSKLMQLRDSRSRLQAQYPLSDHDELWALVSRFDNCDNRIVARVSAWKGMRQRMVLIAKMNGFSRYFDSLLAVGNEYASRKSADSVRSVKLRADDQWVKVESLKASSEKEFETDSLDAIYKHIESVRAKIQELSEVEKMKIRDILLIVAAVVAAVTMILTFTRSILMTRKSNKTPSIEI